MPVTMVTTRSGKTVDVISQIDLRDPMDTGIYMRAYCHIHGSDHQRSLSIDKQSGWGRCFNAACQATVLVREWNPTAAKLLLHQPAEKPPINQPVVPIVPITRPPLISQPILLREPREIPKWQQEELSILLELEGDMRNALVQTGLVNIYLRERGIPLEIAQLCGVGYLPSSFEGRKRHWTLRRWGGRIDFPLYSPTGRGFIGRTLRHWRPGMDENAHKQMLDRPHRPRRWTKTNPAGWFCSPLEQLASCVILVEGAFDRLTLLAAGFAEQEVVALAGTSIQPGWFPSQIKSVILALDGDEGGQEASSKIAAQLYQEGYGVHLCPTPQDGQGKDWNERWRRLGWEGLTPLWDKPTPYSEYQRY